MKLKIGDPCPGPECVNLVRAKELCWGHWRQQHEGKELVPLRVRRDGCDFPGCDKPHMAKGHCGGHHQQILAGKELTPLRGAGDPEHGRLWTYGHHGCRCDECRAANTEAVAKVRAKLFEADRALVPHGVGGYQNWGCRCEVCSAAHSAEMAEDKQARWGKEPPTHGSSGYQHWGCRCEVCHAGAIEDWLDSFQANQQKTLPGAHRSGYVWTGPELEIVGRKDLSALDAALMLGRTYAAVSTARARLREDPRFQFLAGLPEDEEGGVYEELMYGQLPEETV